MKYIVYPVSWASGAPTGIDVLKEFNVSFVVNPSSEPKKYVDEVITDISGEVLEKIAKKYSILIWHGNNIAFDGYGRKFGQR